MRPFLDAKADSYMVDTMSCVSIVKLSDIKCSSSDLFSQRMSTREVSGNDYYSKAMSLALLYFSSSIFLYLD